jgi:D-inositol-3-phosphate glycosyltransferase
MRICVVSYHSSPLDPVGSGTSGGMSIVIANLYMKLASWCEVDIYVCGKKRCVSIGKNIRVYYVSCQRFDEFANTIIKNHIRRPYDLIHTHYWLSGLTALFIRKKIKIPWLHSFHTVEMFKGIVRDKTRIEIENEIIHSCDYIVSPTQREAVAIKNSFPGSHIITIPHGVDTQQFMPSPNGHAKLLFVGRVDPIKGLDILIDALRILQHDVHLDIVGGPSKDEGNYDNIKSHARNLRVNFVGTVKHEKLSECYRNASVVIVPSYYESFGLVGLEAMASARPVVGFEDTGLSETVGNDAGILVKRNIYNLRDAITHIINNHSLCYELGRKGRKKALHYDWHDIAKRYHKTYEEIIKG